MADDNPEDVSDCKDEEGYHVLDDRRCRRLDKDKVEDDSCGCEGHGEEAEKL